MINARISYVYESENPVLRSVDEQVDDIEHYCKRMEGFGFLYTRSYDRLIFGLKGDVGDVLFAADMIFENVSKPEIRFLDFF